MNGSFVERLECKASTLGDDELIFLEKIGIVLLGVVEDGLRRDIGGNAIVEITQLESESFIKKFYFVE